MTDVIHNRFAMPTSAQEQRDMYYAVLDQDSREVPAIYRERGDFPPGMVSVKAERYTSQEFHDQEVEKVWKKVWQVACREEDIPDAGDYHVYQIAGISVLVVRQRDGSIRAHHNVCLHRARTLKEVDGTADNFQCQFHGITWDLDGELKHMPCRWDFPQVPDKWPLHSVKVDSWGGFIFINLDPNSGTLAEFLGDMPRHFEKWPLEKRYKQVHVGKILRCNWKIAQEAFMESWHVVSTHPQLLPGLGDVVTVQDAWENFSRVITPNGVTSPHLNWQPTQQEMLDALVDRNLDEERTFILPDEEMTARRYISDNRRNALENELGAAAQELSDAEMVDSMVYTLFPNFHPWGSYNRTVYRFRPNGSDPNTCIMECMILSPYVGERPRGAKLHMLDIDDDWTEAVELGLLTRVFNQDGYNMPMQQNGLNSGSIPEIVFAEFQETKMRHFHTILDQWMNA